MLGPQPRSPLASGDRAAAFTAGALHDTATRAESCFGQAQAGGVLGRSQLVEWARDAGLAQLLVPLVPVGPVADTLADLPAELADAGIALQPFVRGYDRLAWPHGGRGFFQLKKHIPAVLDSLGL